MTLAAIASSLSRRHVVRAFSSNGYLPSSSLISSGSNGNYLTTSINYLANRGGRASNSNSMTVLLSSKREASHHFSTTASDRELEMALDDLLSDVNDVVVGGGSVGKELERSHRDEAVEERGHRDFPKELVDVVRYFLTFSMHRVCRVCSLFIV